MQLKSGKIALAFKVSRVPKLLVYVMLC